jgi:hypothetical protein
MVLRCFTSHCSGPPGDTPNSPELSISCDGNPIAPFLKLHDISILVFDGHRPHLSNCQKSLRCLICLPKIIHTNSPSQWHPLSSNLKNKFLQQQVPLPPPCYDLTPVKDPTLTKQVKPLMFQTLTMNLLHFPFDQFPARDGRCVQDSRNMSP